MVGRRTLLVCAASALLLGAAPGAALAQGDGLPFEQLIQVWVNNQNDVDNVTSNYDAAEYKKVESDGRIQLNVFATKEEQAALKAAGYTLGDVIEDSKTGPT